MLIGYFTPMHASEKLKINKKYEERAKVSPKIPERQNFFAENKIIPKKYIKSESFFGDN